MSKLIDLTARRFGKLIVLKRAPKKGRHLRWRCRCDCGGDAVVSGDNLKSGHTSSCGCAWHVKRFPRADLTGKRFGKLRVQKYAGRRPPAGDSFWKCVCDCGGQTVVRGYSLKVGNSKSCGCQIRVGLLRANTKHGKTKTVEYRRWTGMLSRCYNKKEKAYKYYGARGIRVCKRWRGEGGFIRFLADMGPCPGAGFEIDRINNARSYTPNNCRWVTRKEQMGNTTRTVWVELNGKRMCQKQACDLLGLNYYAVRHRMKKGLDFEDVVRECRVGHEKSA